jgi:broad specificity phosphatase PhoE
MARLILIRHAESIANAEGRFTRGPHEPLSRRGREEALGRARALRERFDPVALYTSPFVRALETARLVGRMLGLEPIVVEALREQDFGELRGRPYDALDRVQREREGPWRFRPPGGETLEEVLRRAGPALDEIAERHLGAEVIVVSHGGVLAALGAWSRGGAFDAPVLHATATGYMIVRRQRRYEGPFPLARDDAGTAVPPG